MILVAIAWLLAELVLFPFPASRNIWSASSRTKMITFLVFIFLLFSRQSKNFPGVPTMIWFVIGPWGTIQVNIKTILHVAEVQKKEIETRIKWKANILTTSGINKNGWTLVYLANLERTSKVCMANSLVGETQRAWGCCKSCLIRDNIPKQKAAVFPVPDWAWPIIFWPLEQSE